MRSIVVALVCVTLAGAACDPDGEGTVGSDDDGPSVAAVVSTDVPSDQTRRSTLSTESEAPPAEVITCDSAEALAEVEDLLRSGQPTMDYSPAASLEQLVEWADVVVAGELVGARRVLTGEIDAYTSLAVASVEVLAGEGEVAEVGLSSWWAHPEPDPLADEVALEGVDFVGFLGAVPTRYGSWSPYPQGLVFGCGTTTSLTGSWAGHPPGSDGRSLDVLASDVRAIAAADSSETTKVSVTEVRYECGPTDFPVISFTTSASAPLRATAELVVRGVSFGSMDVAAGPQPTEFVMTDLELSQTAYDAVEGEIRIVDRGGDTLAAQPVRLRTSGDGCG